MSSTYLVYADILLILWLAAALVMAMVARARNRNFLKWLLIGILFGFPGLMYVLMFMKHEKPELELKHKDPVDRKLWYLKMKEEFEKTQPHQDFEA